MQHNGLVSPDPVVLRADDTRRATLEQKGRRVTARSWGAADNTAIRTANQRLGYVIDEEWLTLTPLRLSPLCSLRKTSRESTGSSWRTQRAR